MFKSKKGLSLGAAPAAVMLLIMIGLVAVVGLRILSAIPGQSPSDTGFTYVNSSIGNATAGIQQITSNMTLIGIIVIMAIVIGLLFAAFGGSMGGSGGL